MLFLPPDEFADVMSVTEYAVWQAQEVEQVVGQYLVMVHKLKPGMARAEAEAMFAQIEKRTLGQVFAAIRDGGGAAAGLLPRLERFVDDRNWLVHRSRHDSHTDLYQPVKRAALVQRICGIAEEALSLMKAFQQATEKHLIAGGMSKSDIDARTEQIRREWTNRA